MALILIVVRFSSCSSFKNENIKEIIDPIVCINFIRLSVSCQCGLVSLLFLKLI